MATSRGKQSHRVLVFERGDEVELAQALLDRLRERPLTFDEGAFHAYENGVWRALAGEQVRAIVASFAGSAVLTRRGRARLRLSSAAIRGAVRIAEDALVADTTRPCFANAPRGVAFKNGFVTVERGIVSLKPHAPENMARFAYGFAFDPRVPHARLDEHFDVVFGDVSEDERTARVMLLQEFTGASLIGDATGYQRCLVFVSKYSGGGEGKGTTLEILRSIFPSGAVAALPPSAWSERFQLVELIGKRANFVDELPNTDVEEAATFKKVVTGDPTHVDVKNHNAITFCPEAGHIFACNDLPGTKDTSEGFFRRFIPIEFGQILAELSCHRVNVARELVENELPGLLAWAIEGAARAQQRNGYTMPDGSVELLQTWRRASNPVRAFLLEEPPTEPTSGRQLYERYRAWAGRGGYPALNETLFGMRAKASRLVVCRHRAYGNVYEAVRAATSVRAEEPAT
jgi:P4 family phage/plasmid primase-like protien